MDEFDETDALPLPYASGGISHDPVARQRLSMARLISRAYRTARAPLRARIVQRLVRPLGTLSLIAVASGAFGRMLHDEGGVPGIDAFARYSDRQVLDLAQFVQDVDPTALQQVIGLLAENPLGVAALTASAVALLYGRTQRGGKATAASDDADGVSRS